MKPRAAVLLVSLFTASSAHAADFYIDPQSGSPANDGTAGSPWRTLQEVIDAGLIESQGWESLPYDAGKQLVPKNPGAPVQAGDTIWLRSGYHGDVTVTGYYNVSPVTIAAESGQTPRFSRVRFVAGANWLLRGLHVSPEFAPAYDPATMISLESHDWQGPIHDITVEDCVLRSVADVSGWSMADWDTLSANAISASGDNMIIRGNDLKNVNFGISVTATDSLVEHNTIDSFAGDGLRGLGDHTVFQYNTVKNCYDVNANHDDGFQSWSVGTDGQVGTGEVVGIVLRGNRIINYEDPNQPFRGTLQGIGAFDGTYVDWVIENNVIIVDHWHGITLMGARNCRVVNNTVVDLNDVDPGPPWIRISAHKNGTPPEGCIVRNNLATAFNSDATGVVADHNLELDDLAAFFVNPGAFDLHLLQTAPAVDTGSPDLAPGTDLEGIPRPQGAGFDLGAYEWHDPSVVPDAGEPDTGAAGTGGAGNDAAAGGAGGESGTGGAGGGPLPDSGIAGSAGTNASGGASGSTNATPAASGDDGGCGCRTRSDSNSTGRGSGLALPLLGWWIRRRRGGKRPHRA